MEQKDLVLLNEFLSLAYTYSSEDEEEKLAHSLYRLEKAKVLETHLFYNDEELLEEALDWASGHKDHAGRTELTWQEITQPDQKDRLLDIFKSYFNVWERKFDGDKVNYWSIYIFINKELPKELAGLVYKQFGIGIDQENAVPEAMHITQSMLLKSQIKHALEERIPRHFEVEKATAMASTLKTVVKTRQRRM